VQKQQIIFLSVGAAVGLIAIVVMKTYMTDVAQAERKKAQAVLQQAQQSQAIVMVARQDIPAGTTMQGAYLESVIVPREYIQPQAATSIDSVSGMIAVAPIGKGEQVTLSKLAPATTGKNFRSTDLAQLTPMGRRAVPVPVENIDDLVGLLKPGDYVDVIATLTLVDKKTQAAQQTITPVFQNILVLAIGLETAAVQDSEKQKKPLVTLALTPKETNIITFLQEQGKIRLVLRSAEDSQIEIVRPVNWDNIFEYVPSLRDNIEGESIEIIRGTERDRIPVSNGSR